jgi:hypothetical protein
MNWFLPMLAWMSPRFGNGDGFEPFVPALEREVAA